METHDNDTVILARNNTHREITLKQLAEICLELQGGGMTIQNTIDALSMQRALLENIAVTVHNDVWKIKDKMPDN